uniref:DUF2161 family putative PD-(D/E)XK-type phosphodiesterase n=1 Tax=Acetivibrio cellulolyticus TaxID=35830 RepID=UPI0001E2E275|nr:DUF2161 family putative PD-(D/E)XK-type phosphodiesterase [Acetivibrio cellulolyticus]
MKEKKKGTLYEEDLYAPIRDYLTGEGYTVKGEVKHCDVMAVKYDEMLVVEMKKTLNLDVILQAAIRQRLTDRVYIAVPKKGKLMFTKRWKNICYLLRRLELGLFLVSFKGDIAFVEEVITPQPFNRNVSIKRSNRKKRDVLNEFSKRHGDYNTGGCTGKKLVTAYREEAIHIGALISKYGDLSPKSLKKLGADKDKTSKILQDNHYGWFDRVARGVYALTDKGKAELYEYHELVDFYLKEN